MDISETKITQVNITVQFESLDNDLISRGYIRKSFQEEQILITDLPGVVLVVFQKITVQANYSNKRLVVTRPIKESIDDTVAILSKASLELVKAVPDAKILSYDFNIAGKCMTNNPDINQYFLDASYGGAQSLEELIDAHIVSVAPSFRFEKYGALFGVSLMPNEVEKNDFSFQCNIHFMNDSIPEETDLDQQFKEYVEYFKISLRML